MNYELLAADLLDRTRDALVKICQLAVDTGITFKVDDVVQMVEDDLPGWYPAPTAPGAPSRRDMVATMTADLLRDRLGGVR
ncbi:MAG: hypothetical protein F2534_15105 [Actinobacteria bacterium]|nr:hypothetical protein [Actinomycetota bacterium]